MEYFSVFISPNCRTVKELDLEYLKAIHQKVNVVPIIAKADSLTIEERHELRKEIIRVLDKNKINVYAFPDTVDDSQAALIRKMRRKSPFCIISGGRMIDAGAENLGKLKFSRFS